MASRPSSFGHASVRPTQLEDFARGVADIALLERTLPDLRVALQQRFPGAFDLLTDEPASRPWQVIVALPPAARRAQSRSVVSSVQAGDLLELHEAAGAFERIEAHLEAAGFFAADGLAAGGRRADVYLGYGLSEGLRRTDRRARPEPAALPLAACRIRGT